MSTCLVPHSYQEIVRLLQDSSNTVIGSGYFFQNEDKDFFSLPRKTILLNYIKDLYKITRTEQYLELGSMTSLATLLQFLRREQGGFASLIRTLEMQFILVDHPIITIYDLLKIQLDSPRFIALLYSYKVEIEYLTPSTKKRRSSKSYELNWRSFSVQKMMYADQIVQNDAVDESKHLLTRIRFPAKHWTHQLCEKFFFTPRETPYFLTLLLRLEENAIEDLELRLYSSDFEVFTFNTWEEYLLGYRLPLTPKSQEALLGVLLNDLKTHSKNLLITEDILPLLNTFLQDSLLQFYLEEIES